MRILSTLCVFNRNRHWDESKRRWIGMKRKKRNTSEIENIHRLPIRKEKKVFLKRRYDKMWHSRKKIPFYNVSRQKIIECLRNEFNWKLKSNKTHNSIDDMDLLNSLPNRTEIDFKSRKVFIFRLSSSSLSLLLMLFSPTWAHFEGNIHAEVNFFFLKLIFRVFKLFCSYSLLMADWLN